jgi:Zn-dependent M28 family amino/carboxypeptidase
MRGRMQLKSDSHAWPIRGLPILLFASPEVAEAVLSGSGQSLNDIRQRAFQDSMFTPVIIDRTNVTVNMRTSVEDREAENVVGLLEGSDPVLKKQVVVFSAHFDHLGMGTDGAIYHGADDDASGTSMVMELAAAYTKNLVRPKRSLLFLTVSGEEKGLLGSNYYTTHPIIPLDETIADFNTDMIGRIDTTHEKTKDVPYTYIIGSDKISTELDSVLQVANKESNNLQIDYTYNNPDDPNRFYQRSDHYNFARKGIPIAFFFTGVHADYHRPTDTVDKILFDRMKEIGQLVYYAGWKTANFSRMFSKNVSSSEYR